MDFNIFSKFGLTKNEINIFITLVLKGTLSATEIAKETGLNYIYYALERLLEKGYISEIRNKGTKNFSAINLNRVYTLEENKLEILKEILTDLDKVKKKIPKDIYVEVFKGKYVIKNIFKDVLSTVARNDELLYIGIDEEKMESLEPLYLKKILNTFKQNKITERLITKKGGKQLEYAKTTKYKEIDPDLIGNTAKLIYCDTVVELIYGNPMYAILMRNQDVAETAKKQFEVFWSIAK
jgi:sugar-specific transcriptional regulator TrmB